jgi:plasmid maintenance system antidote protein VapI
MPISIALAIKLTKSFGVNSQFLVDSTVPQNLIAKLRHKSWDMGLGQQTT